MADHSRIEWTDATWNPTVGCSRVSSGCQHCYAERIAPRLGQPGIVRSTPRGPEWTGKVLLLPERLAVPLRWRAPRRVFVDSMSDLFHPQVPFEFVAKVWTVMAEAQRHTFQILTKRPERMVAFFEWWKEQNSGDGPLLHYSNGAVGHVSYFGAHSRPPPANIWLGTSVENQETLEERILHLLRCPAAVRFLSCEPLLGPLDLARWLPRVETWGPDATRHYVHPVNTAQVKESRRLIAEGKAPGYGMKPEGPSELHWVIAGGESGPGARPMHPDWARQLRDQCAAAGVAFFFKQWGEYEPRGVDPRGVSWGNFHVFSDGRIMARVGKKRAGRVLDGHTHDAYPEAGAAMRQEA